MGPAPADPELRDELFSSVAALVGRWEVQDQEEPSFIEFELSSNNSVVRETMFPNTPHEMTNMYSLDGNSIVMTHYCGAGNQPHMRAVEVKDDKLVFASDGVSDLETPESFFMANMTLSFLDWDHVNESWHGVTAGEDSEMPVFRLVRVK